VTSTIFAELPHLLYRVNTETLLDLSSYKIKTYWNILTKLVATVA